MKGTIIYWGNFKLPDKNASANRVVSNGKIFTKLGYQIVFLGSRSEADYFPGIQKMSLYPNMYEECYPANNKLWLKYVFDISTIQRLVEKYRDTKLVIAYNIPYSKFNKLKKWLKKENIPAVYDCTEWNDMTDGNIIKRLYKKKDLFPIKHYLGKKADGMIVISKRMEQYYHNNNMVRIPPLVDINDEIWHQSVEKHAGRFEFCFAGTISNKEALDKVINAFIRLNKAHCFLRIIGLTKSEVQQLYPGLAGAVDNERMLFMGQLSHKETVKYVQGCDCYIFLRYDNARNQAGFPTKFAEAFSCGVPIITTDVSDIADYMDNNAGGVVLDSLNEERIVGAMSAISDRVLENREVKHEFDYNTYLSAVSVWLNQLFNKRATDGKSR